jgi:urease accessory protein
MHLINQALDPVPHHHDHISIQVDRHKLARKRWRGTATDRTDFGFDVQEALNHGDCVYVKNDVAYVIEQSPEPCFLIPIGEGKHAAWLGWMIGNLHFKASVTEEGILVQDDVAVEQMLERESISFQRLTRIFQPSKSGGHSHDHDHGHSHSHEHHHP